MKVSIMGDNASRKMSIYFQKGELEQFGFTKNDKFEFSCIGTVVTVAKLRRHSGVALCRMTKVDWEAMKSKAREHGFILMAAEGKLKLPPISHEIEI